MVSSIDSSLGAPEPSPQHTTSPSPPGSQPEGSNKTEPAFHCRNLRLSTGPSRRTRYTQRRFPCLSQAAERKARRTVSIATDPTPANLAKCNPQPQSRLFSLPQELRDLIYAFALAPWDDRAHSYGTREYYYRPGHVAKQMVLTDLLLSCRRVWLEANTMAIKQWRPTFWYGRGPESKEWMHGMERGHAKHDRFVKKMTDNALRNVTNLNLHAQMYRIEPMGDPNSGEQNIAALFDPALLRRGFCPRKLRVTIRHSDWWYWENDESLRLETPWVQALLDSPLASCVENFELELETLERKKDQLQPIVDHLRTLSGAARRVNLLDADDTRATRLVCADEDPVISHWTGRRFLDNEAWGHGADLGPRTLDYHIATLTWRAVPCPMPSPPTSSEYIASTTGLLQSYTITELDILFGSPVLDNFDFDSFLMPIEDNHWTRDAFVTWRHVGPAAEICLQNLIAIGSSDSQAARKGEEIRGERFNNGMAALEAEKAKRRWREEGSLMEFA